MDPVRQLISSKIVEYRLTMADVSRQIGRNPAYLQQFISRGVPAVLEETDRKELARILGLDPELLKGAKRQRKWEQQRELSVLKSSIHATVRNNSSGKEAAARDLVKALIQMFGRSMQQNNRDISYYFAVPSDTGTGAIRIAPYSRIKVSRDFITHLSHKGYFLIVPDDSLSPDLRKNAIAFVDRDVGQVQPGMICVLRRHKDENGEAFIRRIKDVTDSEFQTVLLASTEKNNKPAKKSYDSFAKIEWRADVVIGNLFPPIF